MTKKMIKAARECAEYIIANDIGGKKFAGVVESYCPAGCKIKDFTALVSENTYASVYAETIEEEKWMLY